MQNCIPYIKELRNQNLDEQDLANSLYKLSADELFTIVTIMEIGRDHYLMDICTPNAKPEAIYGKHKRVVLKSHQDKTKAELVHYILTKILLCRYMDTAMTVLSL